MTWHCKCECGNECDVEAYALSAGKTVSCGCYKREVTSCRKLHDLVGQRFGRLVVIARSDDYITPNTGARHTRWHCHCDCGNECDVVAISLIRGDTISCGCYFRERTSTRRFIDLTGERFDRLVVLGLSQDECFAASGYRVYKWLCQCDCGAVYWFYINLIIIIYHRMDNDRFDGMSSVIVAMKLMFLVMCCTGALYHVGVSIHV